MLCNKCQPSLPPSLLSLLQFSLRVHYALDAMLEISKFCIEYYSESLRNIDSFDIAHKSSESLEDCLNHFVQV